MMANTIMAGTDLTMNFSWINSPSNVSVNNGTLNGAITNETMYC